MRHTMDRPSPKQITHLSTAPHIVDLSQPDQVRTAGILAADPARLRVYWISPRPPEQILGALSSSEFQGAWISSDGRYACCRIGSRATARVRLPAELRPEGIPDFLRELVRIQLGWDPFPDPRPGGARKGRPTVTSPAPRTLRRIAHRPASPAQR